MAAAYRRETARKANHLTREHLTGTPPEREARIGSRARDRGRTPSAGRERDLRRTLQFGESLEEFLLRGGECRLERGMVVERTAVAAADEVGRHHDLRTARLGRGLHEVQQDRRVFGECAGADLQRRVEETRGNAAPFRGGSLHARHLTLFSCVVFMGSFPSSPFQSPRRPGRPSCRCRVRPARDVF